MKLYFKAGRLPALGLAAALLLSGCSLAGRLGGSQAAQSAASSQSAQSSPDASGSQSASEEYTLQGTLNLLDQEQKYLVLIADELYFRFGFEPEELDLSGLEPGDLITVTYTGALEPESEDVTAQLVSVSKDA